MKKLKALISILMSYPALALAEQYGLPDANGGLPGSGTPTGSFAERLAAALGTIVGSFLAFLGVIFLVLMIAGGVTWMTAGGDEKKVAKAKLLLSSAVVGLIIVLSAYAITAYLGDSVSNF